MTDPQIYYRLVDRHYTTGVTVDTLQFRLVRKTPAGAWIAEMWDRDALYPRFVLDGKGKRYAYPDLEDAKASFLIRKQRQVGQNRAPHKIIFSPTLFQPRLVAC